MSHPRIEEASDSDLSDPSEGDIDDFAESDIIRQKPVKPVVSAIPSPAVPKNQDHHPMVNPADLPAQQQIQSSDIRDYQVLYPVYFDGARSRAQGRRVPSSLAVRNPLARDVAAACADLRLSPVFEAHKTHPRDWANPGRVRVRLRAPKKPKKQGSSSSSSSNNQENPYAAQINNKHHLYVLVAQILRSKGDVTDASESLRRVRVPGLQMPDDDEAWPRPAVPRGWKMNEFVPAYSAAMTGGGVSENAFRDMMKDVGGAGAGGGGLGGMPGADMMSSMLGGLAGGGGGGPSGGGGGGGGKIEEGKKKGKKGKR